MRTSRADEALQSKQPRHRNALGEALPAGHCVTWRTRVELWWNSRTHEGAVERTVLSHQRFLAVLVSFAMLLLSGSSAFAARKRVDFTQKVSPELVQYFTTPSWSRIDVVVQYVVKPGNREAKDIQDTGGTVRGKYKAVHAMSITVPGISIPYIAKMEEVVYISLDRPVRMSLDHATKTVSADVGWSYGLKGKGVAIAVIDSGVWNHLDLNELGGTSSRVVYSESFIPGDTRTDDFYGHGTHVAGIAAGNGQSSAAYQSQYKGAAPEANIVNLRVLDANGRGSDSAVIAAIDRAIALKSRYNIGVINLSLGRPVYEHYSLDPLCQAVEAAWRAGIVVVTAAGNMGRDNSFGTHGFGTIAAPANDPYVITVGATDMKNTSYRSDDAIASYSSKGPTLLDHVVKPDLVAPGNRVVSLIDPNGSLEAQYPRFNICDTPNGNCGNSAAQYYRLSGTSMAAPIVSGAAALMLQNDPSLTPDLIKARMMKTAWKGFATFSNAKDVLGNSYQNQADIFTYGAGYLDVQAALNSADTGTGAALSPSAIYDPSTGLVSLGFGPSGNSVIWGSSVLWGSSVIWGSAISDTKTNALWGSSVIWGSSLDAGFSVIWGSSVIWGASTNSAFSPGDDGDCSLDDPTCGDTILTSTTQVVAP